MNTHSIKTPMRPDRGSHVTDGKQHLSTLQISFPYGKLRYIESLSIDVIHSSKMCDV